MIKTFATNEFPSGNIIEIAEEAKRKGKEPSDWRGREWIRRLMLIPVDRRRGMGSRQKKAAWSWSEWVRRVLGPTAFDYAMKSFNDL
jgi:hypothetical protein